MRFKITNRKFFLVLIITLLSIVCVYSLRSLPRIALVKADTPTDWTQLQHDAQHKGSTTVQVDPPYSAAWVWMDKTHIVHDFVNGSGKSITDGFSDIATYTQQVLFNTQMQPIVAQNQVFFGSLNGTFYSVNGANGNNIWDYTTGGPILATAAYYGGTVVVASMDGKLYALNATNGSLVWTFNTGGGVSAPPVIASNVVYVGSRSGSFYAINLSDGTQKWKYDNRIEPANSSSPYNKAPIVSAAAISEDGSTIFFGAENVFFYALNTADGTEKWAPKKQNGQSFQGTWPVVKGNLVMVSTGSSYGTPEYNMESVLDGLPASPTWAQQRDAINSWLNTNPQWRLFRVYNVSDGSEPYQPATGPYAPFGLPYVAPVVDNSSRILWPYWRVKDATFFKASGSDCYGSKYSTDIGQMDETTGDKINLTNNQSTKFCPEIDNVFNVTVGGNNFYLQEAFRGVLAFSLTDGSYTRVSAAVAHWDYADNRGWGYNIIYYGNDSQPVSTTISPKQPWISQNGFGLGSGAVPASVSGTPMLFVNESDVSAIVGLIHTP